MECIQVLVHWVGKHWRYEQGETGNDVAVVRAFPAGESREKKRGPMATRMNREKEMGKRKSERMISQSKQPKTKKGGGIGHPAGKDKTGVKKKDLSWSLRDDKYVTRGYIESS